MIMVMVTDMGMMNLAGMPPTSVRGLTSLVTTAPAAIIAPLPMVTPGVMVTFAPIHTSSPMRMGLNVIEPRFAGSWSWFIVAITQL